MRDNGLSIPWLVHPALAPSPRTAIRIALWLTALNLLLGLLYCLSFRLAQSFRPSDGVIAALNLDAEGSLGAWSNATLLFIAACVVGLICRVRSTQGAGRRELFCWSWTACVLAIMSADEGGSLHEAFKELCVRLVGSRLYGDGSIYWAVPYAILLGWALAGSFHYLRGNPLARSTVLLGGFAYLIAAALQLELLLPTEDPLEIVAEELLETQGTVFLLGAFLAQLAVVLQSAIAFPIARTLASEKARVRVVVAGKPRSSVTGRAASEPPHKTATITRERAA